MYDPTQGDEDADGIGDACDQCPANSPDVDEDGFCAAQDCDDNDPLVYPGAEELYDGLDNACQGYVVPTELDEDGDGERICDGDCDDAQGTVHPNAPEVCDGLDNDCDERTDDEGAIGCSIFYQDDDEDSFGDPNDFECLCAADEVRDRT